MNDPLSQQPGGGTIFDEIRRQIEEMARGRQPAGPQVIRTQAPAARPDGGGQVGLALAATASYWALAVAARRKQRRSRRPSPPGDVQS